MQLQGTYIFIFVDASFSSQTLNMEEYMTRHDKQFPKNTHLTFSNILLFMAGSSNCESAHLQTCMRGVGGFNEKSFTTRLLMHAQKARTATEAVWMGGLQSELSMS
jgi:hypothetical protein